MQFPNVTLLQKNDAKGMLGFYMLFCLIVDSSFTIDSKFIWSNNCQNDFENGQPILKCFINSSTQITVDLRKQFKLAVDANDVGIGPLFIKLRKLFFEKPISNNKLLIKE